MKIKDGFKQMAEATNQALINIRKSSDAPIDQDLIRYESLTPESFEILSKDYGQDNVLEYIKEMEVRRLAQDK